MIIKIIGLSCAACAGGHWEQIWILGAETRGEELAQVYLLALGVQGRGGLVQQQDLGVTDDRPGNGNALLLAAGKLRTLGAHVGVVFLRQQQQERFQIPLAGSEKPSHLTNKPEPGFVVIGENNMQE